MKPLAPTAVERLERIAAGLVDPTDLDAAVHTTRTGIKRLRAFLRLARGSIGADAYRVENSALRDTARLLAPARDALVLIETARDNGVPESELAILARGHTGALATLESGARVDAVERLQSIGVRWAAIDWRGPEPESVRNGIRKTYRRGRTDLDMVRSQANADAFHGWRRRVKYLRYQLEAIGAPDRFTTPYTALGDDLGLDHDQTVLMRLCDGRAADEGFRTLGRRTAARREDLRSRTLELGGRLFARSPKAFLQSIERLVDLR